VYHRHLSVGQSFVSVCVYAQLIVKESQVWILVMV